MHKLEKMEILNQKAERQQAKRDIEFIKEIEERVKKEMKNLTGGNSGTASLSSTTPGIKRESSNKSQRLSIISSKFTEGGLPSIHESNNSGLLRVSEVSEGQEDKEKEGEERARLARSSIVMPRRSSTLDETSLGSNWNDQIEIVLSRWGDRLKQFE